MITQRKRRKMNPMLLKVLVISAVVHIAGLFVLGGITLVRYVIPDEAQFDEPPKMTEEEPPPEVKIEIKPQKKPEMEPMKNLRTRKIGNIAVADIAVDLPSGGDSFTISGGLGNLGGTSNLIGSTRGKLSFGMSQVNVFGIKAKAERILFVIDTNEQMITDNKGGINSYRVIKNEIADLVGNLNAGTLFNVMLQDRTVTLLFKPRLVNAGSDAHSQLIRWISPINSNPNRAGLSGIPGATRPYLRALTNDPIQAQFDLSWQGNETAFITQYAIEQGIDTIFFITGYHAGFSTVQRRPNEREAIQWQKTINDPKYKAALARHQAEIPQMEQRVREALNGINAERRSKGEPDRVLNSRWGVYSDYRELGLKWNTEHPGFEPRYEIDPQAIARYFKKLNETIYGQFDKPSPSINVVLFLAEDEFYSKQDEKQLRDYVRHFNGRNRIIRGEKGIKRASNVTGIGG